MADIITIRPGLLVSLHTSIKGGVKYSREDLGKQTAADGAKSEEWKTKKTVDDPDEYEIAIKIRGKCGSLIRGVCSAGSFGLLCPEEKETELNKAIQDARALASAFNEKAQLCRVDVFVLKGRIAQTDNEATRAISEDMRNMLDEMKDSIAEANVEKIRIVAVKALKVGKMLEGEPAKKVTAAVEEAREIAKKIVKAASSGQIIADVVQQAKLEALDAARFAFLDTSDDKPIEGEQLPPVEARALDLGEEPEQITPENYVDQNLAEAEERDVEEELKAAQA